MSKFDNMTVAGGRLTRRAVLAGAAAGAGALYMPQLVVAAEPGKISMMMPNLLSPAFAEVLNAKARGHFENEGLEVELAGVRSGVAPIQSVITDQATVGRTGAIGMVQAVGKGADIKAIASISQLSSIFIISLESNPIKVPQDIVGETIGVVSLRGPMDLSIDAMLASAGLPMDAADRQVVSDNPSSIALIEAGRIKGFWGNSETVARIRNSGAKIHVLSPQEFLPLPSQVYLSRQSEIDNNADTLAAFLKAVDASIRQIVADADLDDTIAGLKSLDVGGLENVDAAKATIRGVQRGWLGAGEENILRNMPDNWAKGTEVAVKMGIIEDIAPTSFYTNDLVDRALGGKS